MFLTNIKVGKIFTQKCRLDMVKSKGVLTKNLMDIHTVLGESVVILNIRWTLHNKKVRKPRTFSVFFS